MPSAPSRVNEVQSTSKRQNIAHHFVTVGLVASCKSIRGIIIRNIETRHISALSRRNEGHHSITKLLHAKIVVVNTSVSASLRLQLAICQHERWKVDWRVRGTPAVGQPRKKGVIMIATAAGWRLVSCWRHGCKHSAPPRKISQIAGLPS